MKRCARCKQDQPLSVFLRDYRGYKDGYGSYCRTCRAAYHRDRRKLYPERYRKWDAAKYVRDREKIRVRQAKRSRDSDKERQKRRYAADPLVRARVSANTKAWRSANPDKLKAQAIRVSKNRRARLKGAPIVISFTQEHFQLQLDIQQGKCFYCEEPMQKPTLDHFISLADGGSHTPANIVLACKSCNSRKGTLSPQQFFQKLGEVA